MNPFSHPEKEKEIAGYIIARGFENIPETSIVSPDAFTIEEVGVIYATAYNLHRKGRGVTLLTIRESVAKTDHYRRIMEAFAKREGYTEWSDFTYGLPDGLVFQPKIAAEYLDDIRDAHERRKSSGIAKLLEAGEISREDAIKELQAVQDTLSTQSVLPLLDSRKIVASNPPPKPVPVLSLCGQPISTAGNLTVISAKAKVGKSATIGASLASILGGDETDCLGFEADQSVGKAIIHFDTEQTPYDAWLLLSRSMKRAGITKQPDNLRAYYLLDLPIKQRRAALAEEMKRAEADCGGIHSVIVDGIADMCVDVNDPAESNGLVDEVIALAVKHSCPIITVLHENPGENQTGKTRGHLGSQLERKAESNLRVVKDADGVSTIFSERCRKASIPQNVGPRFRWDETAGMHVSCEPAVNEKAEESRKELEDDAMEVFKCPEATGGLSWADLHKRIEVVFAVKHSGARKVYKRLIAAGIVKKNSRGDYHL